MIFAFYTLGCKVNQYETQAMEQLLTAAGHTVAGWDGDCDGYIINTCSVTAVADKKNRNIIRRCRREHPNAVIAVCGCHSQHDPEAMKALGVDLIGGSAHRADFIHQLLLLSKSSRSDTSTMHCALCTVHSEEPPLKRKTFELLPPGGLSERTRAMLKVQDGCVNFCSYCIIPYTRGPVRSAPLETALAQAEELSQKGYQEIVLTGIEIASWGVDLPDKPTLTDLVEAICEKFPHLRIRLGSLEPRVITQEFCQRLGKFSNLCPHFHLSMQSGCDTVLRRMKRKYDTARYYESLTLLREAFPLCNITTDMIVAFPGETEEEFAQSLAFIQKCGFGDMHIFPYSRRPGTPADKMPGQHSNATKEDRAHRANEIARQMNKAYRTAHLGKTVPVLFEEQQEGKWVGHTPSYIKVYALGENLHNQEHPVTLTELYKDGLFGQLS